MFRWLNEKEALKAATFTTLICKPSNEYPPSSYCELGPVVATVLRVANDSSVPDLMRITDNSVK